MDERYEMIRVIRDKRFLYMKNYMPHRAHGQHVAYMFQTPSTRAWYKRFADGLLSPEHAYFWKRKAPEELYDLEADPDEVRNLAGEPEHEDRLRRMRGALGRFLQETRDVGFVPEPDYHTVYSDRILYELARDEEAYPLALIREVAQAATGQRYDPGLVSYLDHANPSVRYWAVTGMLIHEASIDRIPIEPLQILLDDVSPSVRIVAAELMARHGSPEDSESALSTLLELSNVATHHVTVATFALNALDNLEEFATPIISEIVALPMTTDTLPNRNRNYISDLIAKIEDDLH
jgi:uncharacterized sulfatase